MGCDIHFYTEKRQPSGNWEAVGTFVRDNEDNVWITQQDAALYSGRNYNLFAILADVRNGRGFAGIKTGEGFNPIAPPRGLPDDVSLMVRSISNQWGEDGHSHSHLTLRELLEYDWTQETKLQGWVDAEEWARWSLYDRGHGFGPDSYCSEVGGKDIKHVTATEMDALLEPIADDYTAVREEFARQYANTYALAEWSVSYANSASHFLSHTLPALLKLAGGTDGTRLDDVRCVFFFDN